MSVILSGNDCQEKLTILGHQADINSFYVIKNNQHKHISVTFKTF